MKKEEKKVKVEELRIGNLIQTPKSEIAAIDEIHDGIIGTVLVNIIDMPLNQQLGFGCRDIKPIDINELILNWLGFIKINELHDGTIVYGIAKLPRIYFKDGLVRFPFTTMTISSVHILQNVWYFVTGLELIFTPHI